MKKTGLYAIPAVSVLLVIAIGFVVFACGGGVTTTTESTTTTTAATTTSAGPGGAAPIKIEVQLSGAEVVPPVQTSASGTFTLLVEALPTGSFNISYELDVKDIVDVTAAHIHLAPKGQEGPVVVPLFTGPEKSGSFTGVLAKGTITEKDLQGPLAGQTFMQLSGAVLAGQTYVNVHTKANPNGEIRGQIVVAVPGVTPTTAAGGAATTTSGAGGY